MKNFLNLFLQGWEVPSFYLFVVSIFLLAGLGFYYLDKYNKKVDVMNFAKKFGKYTYWAFAQQMIVLSIASFFDLPFNLILSVIIFGPVAHFMNWRLTLFTSIFAIVFYSIFFCTNIFNVFYISLLHAFGGSLYYFTGWDMRTWRFK